MHLLSEVRHRKAFRRRSDWILRTSVCAVMADNLDRRSYPRVDVTMPVSFRSLRRGRRKWGTSLNVSASGLLFESEEAWDLQPGAEVDLLLAVPSWYHVLGRTRFLSGSGKVVRVAPVSPETEALARVRVSVEFSSPLRFED